MPDEPLPEVYATLKESVDRLKKLLDSPQPGLWSWCKTVAVETHKIAALYQGESAHG